MPRHCRQVCKRRNGSPGPPQGWELNNPARPGSPTYSLALLASADPSPSERALATCRCKWKMLMELREATADLEARATLRETSQQHILPLVMDDLLLASEFLRLASELEALLLVGADVQFGSGESPKAPETCIRSSAS
mmetsp:Transcript_7129/g.21816  ORF Transcript_7129/g.21816 Transcript_7129/m.21816 type:complete len:138 (+) Transcript_7129:1301-1714(+)